MPRTTIAAALAMLLFLAPAASAKPADTGYPAYPTPEVAAMPKVMPERVTDHPAPMSDDVRNALAQEQSYSTKGNAEVGGLVPRAGVDERLRQPGRRAGARPRAGSRPYQRRHAVAHLRARHRRRPPGRRCADRRGPPQRHAARLAT